MGTIKQGILGGFSGKVGSVIGGSWKGISYMRGIALSISNPRTPGQLAQRAKWSLAMTTLRPMSQLLRNGFRKAAIRMTAFNAAFKNFMDHSISGTYPSFTVNYPNVLLANGTLAPSLNAVAASTVAGTVLFTWDDNSGEGNANADDTTVLAFYNPVKHQNVYIKDLAERADGTQTVTVPDSWSGDQVQCYIYFNTAVGAVADEVSPSAYAGAVTVA